MSGPQIAEIYDLNDFVTDTCRPTANLIQIQIRKDGTAHFALPRSENGQGIVTSTAMIIAEELELPVWKVVVTLADARPELLLQPADRRLHDHHLDLHPDPRRRRHRQGRAAGRRGDHPG